MSKHKTRQINRITAATLDLIDREGLGSLNISNIAEAAGVTRQTIYNYFPDVESIVAQALEAHGQAMERHQLGLLEAADGVESKLYALAEFHISNASEEHSNLSFEVVLPAQSRAKFAEHTEAIKAKLALDLAPMMERPEVTAALLWAMIEGSAVVAAKYPKQKKYLLDSLINAMKVVVRD